MNTNDYARFQGEQFAALRKEFPSVQSCGGCELTRLLLLHPDTPVTSYSKNELERMVKNLRIEAAKRCSNQSGSEGR